MGKRDELIETGPSILVSAKMQVEQPDVVAGADNQRRKHQIMAELFGNTVAGRAPEQTAEPVAPAQSSISESDDALDWAYARTLTPASADADRLVR